LQPDFAPGQKRGDRKNESGEHDCSYDARPTEVEMRIEIRDSGETNDEVVEVRQQVSQQCI
jgi:hypothetical protein